MNLCDRFLETVSGGRADRVPLDLDGFQFASRAQIEALTDPARREISRLVFDYCHSFVHCRSYVNRYFVTPPQLIVETSRKRRDGSIVITSEIDTPKGKLTVKTGRNPVADTVWIIKYPVESLHDIEKICSVPWELPLDLAPPGPTNLRDRGRSPWALPSDATRSDLVDLTPSLRERCVVRADVSSPFVCVASTMSFQYFLELCATELGLLKELTAECTERILEVLDVLLSDRGIDYVFIGGCEWLTPPMGSPRHYEELVQEFEAKLISRIHRGGAVAHVHCHGNVRSTLDSVIQRGADFFEPVEPPPDGDIAFAEAKAVARGRMTLGGNIEARLIEMATPDEMEEAVRRAFEGDVERMVLKPTSGPISRLTPRMLANYHRLIDVWEELSPL